jgi:acetyltransferase
MSIRDLDYIFRPSSIALVGASNRPKSVGAVLARNLMRAGFQGPIMPVNPKHRAIGGVLAWPSVADLPMVPDLGVVCTPADAVPGVIAELRAKGAQAAVVITAGFGDGGDSDGETRREAMLEASQRMRIIGPNVLGVLVPGAGLNASFAHIDAAPGDLAFVSQSGAVVTSVLDWAAARGIGFSHMVSLGDMADVDFGDMLDYLALQPDVRAILLYVEAVTNARKFLSAARIAARSKPVIVIKAGRVPEGAKAASSHTGALAGSDAVYDAVFRRAGLLRVLETKELFDAVETLAHAPRFAGDRLAILSNGGGFGVLATDRAVEEGCPLATLSPDTVAALDAVLPASWSGGNPIDIIGDASGQRYGDALQATLADKAVDAVLVLNCPTAVADSTEAAQAVVDCRTTGRFPVLTSWLGGTAPEPARKLFSAHGVPTYDTPEDAVRAFAHLMRYRAGQAALARVPALDAEDLSVDRAAAMAVIDAALRDGREWLSEPEAKAVLRAYGVPVVQTLVAETAAEAARQAASFDGPYVIKVHSPDITHKSDVGGVMLDLETPGAVAAAVQAMEERVRRVRPDARYHGVTVQPMVRRPGAFELIVGMSEDAQFGPVLLFGEGGTGVEAIGDTAMALPPLDPALAEALIGETRIGGLLRGYRGRAGADVDAVVDTVLRVARIAAELDAVTELDINPLLADGDGVIVVDARIRVAPVPADAAPGARLAIKPYPAELRGTVTLRDGRPVSVRPIRPTDAPRLKEMFRRADPKDIRMRFMHAMKELPDKLAARLSQIDYAREMAFVAFEGDGGDEAIGVSRLAADANNERAEFAVMVRTDWKGKGLGYGLMGLLIDHARARGLGELFGEILSENQPMIAMCKELGFTVKPMAGEPSISEAVLSLG